MRGFITAVGLGALMAAGCGASGSASVAVATDTAAARAKLSSLEAAARALARTDGCSTSTQCRTAPVGVNACGGPRLYLVYCAVTTDTVALFRKLDELKAVEMNFNQSTNVISTCELRRPPGVVAEGGSCRAVP